MITPLSTTPSLITRRATTQQADGSPKQTAPYANVSMRAFRISFAMAAGCCSLSLKMLSITCASPAPSIRNDRPQQTRAKKGREGNKTGGRSGSRAPGAPWL